MSWKNSAAIALACAASTWSLISSYLSSNNAVTQREAFLQWLTSKGADVEKLRISHSSICDSNGVFLHPTATPAWKLRFIGEKVSNTVASFPADVVLTIETPFSDPLVGEHLYRMFEKFDLSPAVVLALYILIQKKLGERSQWKEWIQMLPSSIQTPLTFNRSKLQELQGTPLMSAAEQMRNDMFACWEKVELLLGQLLKSLGISPRWDLSSVDFMWAIAVVWSRAIEIPNAAADGTAPCLGIVPGLDFFNHSLDPNCTWQPGWHGGKYFYEVKMIHQGQRLRKKMELTISYGDRSNEELLFLYGFVLDMNPYDQLRIPLENLEERQEMPRDLRLPPFIVLPGKDVVRSIKIRPKKRPTEEDLAAWIPLEAWEILEILIESSGNRRSTERITSLEKTTMLRRVLERHQEQLEGSSGTDSLESDIEILKQHGNHQATVVYRSTQKSLTRQWLKVVTCIEAKLQEMQ